ncbi:MAG: putative F420-dependent oxidoreductase [Thermoproteota archaeon]|jgi:probable F420-dependent oxidoreductase
MEIAVTTAFSHHTPVEFIAGAAKRIEAAGFAAVWVPEHVLFFPDYASSYPYADDGKVPGNPEGVLDPFTALTFIAAHTTTLRLGTGICLVPQRQPVYTAKMVADLDYLSNGRVDFGIGVGWLAEEFDALGLDFAARAERCDEYIAAMKELWGPDPVNFSGDTVTINNAQFNPKPVQSPHPPIFVGGESTPALRRVATFADGWYGYGVAPDEVAAKLDRLDGHLEAAGRSLSEIKIYICPNRLQVDQDITAAYAEAGVKQLILPLYGRDLDHLDRRIETLQHAVGTS